MANFDLSIPITLKFEGGKVKDPNDPGGATNMGIILKLFSQIAPSLGLLPTEDALWNLTIDQAKKIYKSYFWTKIGGDQINNQSLADNFFDSIVNIDELHLASGARDSRVVAMVQRAVEVKDDGIIGSNTLQAINSSEQSHTFALLKQSRIDYYNNLIIAKPNLSIYKNNWLRRANFFTFRS